MKNHEDTRFYGDTPLKFEKISSEEELRMFRAARAGDMEIREALIKRHLLFALKQGRRFCRSQLPADETTSAANLALMEAFKNFDPERGTSFRSFLIPYVRGAIAHCWRDKEAVDYKHSVPPPPTDSTTRPEASQELVTLPNVDKEDHEDFLRAQLLELSESLDGREKLIVELHYVQCLDLAEVGRRLKLSRQRIHQIHKLILATLRKKLESRGITSSQ